MPSDKDLFHEEQDMVSMSFGEHIEELRTRLILALMGLAVGMIFTFIPPLDLGKRIMVQMGDPAKQALKVFYEKRAEERANVAKESKVLTDPVETIVPAAALVNALRELAPKLELPSAEEVREKSFTLPLRYAQSDAIRLTARTIEPRDALIALGPLETPMIFFLVCIVAGLVLASPWVFYQVWAFVAAGLYRHERHYVKKFLPLSIGLFLSGVFLCFFGVLPWALSFLLQFNMWLGIEPTLRLGEWMSFATILPLVFGVCFETPLVMLFLERIGVFTVDDYRSKRKMAVLVITVAAALLTPGQDPFSMVLLAVPMVVLYELGIVLIGRSRTNVPALTS